MTETETVQVPVRDCPAGPWMDAAVMRASGAYVHEDENGYLWVASSEQDYEKFAVTGGQLYEDPEGHLHYCRLLPGPSRFVGDMWGLEAGLLGHAREKYTMHLTAQVGKPIVRDGQPKMQFDIWDLLHAPPLARARAFLVTMGVTEVEVPKEALDAN